MERSTFLAPLVDIVVDLACRNPNPTDPHVAMKPLLAAAHGFQVLRLAILLRVIKLEHPGRTLCDTRQPAAAVVTSQRPSDGSSSGSSPVTAGPSSSETSDGSSEVDVLRKEKAQLEKQVKALVDHTKDLRSAQESLKSESALVQELRSQLLLVGQERTILLEQAEAAESAAKDARQELGDTKSALTKDLAQHRTQVEHWHQHTAALKARIAELESSQSTAIRDALVRQRRELKSRMLSFAENLDGGADEAGEAGGLLRQASSQGIGSDVGSISGVTDGDAVGDRN